MPRSLLPRVASVAAVVLAVGCAKASAPMSDSRASAAAVPSAVRAPNAPDPAAPADAKALAVPARKVVRDAEFDVVVPAYQPAAAALEKLATDAGGFIALADVHHELSRVSTATWVLRIPATGLDGALQSLRNLGTVTAEKVNTEDVTEAWVDLKARLDNEKAAEARLVQLLAQKTDKLSDVLDVERELTRVRGEVESLEGKLRLLDHRIDLSTLTVRLRVEERYVPPVEPTLWSRLADTLEGSLHGLREFAELALTVAVALLPWMVVWGPLGWLGLRGLRWVTRKGRAAPVVGRV